MLTLGLVDDMPHANYAEESRIAYDDFLCRFKRMRKETATIWEKIVREKGWLMDIQPVFFCYNGRIR